MKIELLIGRMTSNLKTLIENETLLNELLTDKNFFTRNTIVLIESNVFYVIAYSFETAFFEVIEDFLLLQTLDREPCDRPQMILSSASIDFDHQLDGTLDLLCDFDFSIENPHNQFKGLSSEAFLLLESSPTLTSFSFSFTIKDYVISDLRNNPYLQAYLDNIRRILVERLGLSTET